MTEFSYKNYSFDHLDNWLHDALSNDDVSAIEIYDRICETILDNYIYHQSQVSKTKVLMEKLNCISKVDASDYENK